MPIKHSGSGALNSCSLGACQSPSHQSGLASLVDPVNHENILGKIDADTQNAHGLALPSQLMRVRTSHRGTS